MRYEWDPVKSLSNYRKHKISFELASTIFDDPFHLSKVDGPSSGREERWITIGRSKDLKNIVVIHTYCDSLKDEVIRIISARSATATERKQYEKGI